MSDLKKGLAISLMLHLGLIYSVISQSPLKKNKPPGSNRPQAMAVEILPPSGAGRPQSGNISFHEKTGVKKKRGAGYWGIGIESGIAMEPATIVDNVFYPVTFTVGRIHPGYPAEKAGLQYGDVIYAVDGKPMSDENDIKGPEQREVLLSVKRGSQTFQIRIMRGWIETGG